MNSTRTVPGAAALVVFVVAEPEAVVLRVRGGWPGRRVDTPEEPQTCVLFLHDGHRLRLRLAHALTTTSPQPLRPALSAQLELVLRREALDPPPQLRRDERRGGHRGLAHAVAALGLAATC